jgi:hypothetical protein
MPEHFDDLLRLRRVDHPQARDNYRVIWNGIEVGSIGQQVGASGRTSGIGVSTTTPRRACRSPPAATP